MLSNDNVMNTRKQKFIGTRKHNSEAATITKHTKESDASSKESHVRDVREASSSTCSDDDEPPGQPRGIEEQHAIEGRGVEPRSYRDVVVNGRG